MKKINDMKSIIIEGYLSTFCGYERIKEIDEIKLSDIQLKMFVDCSVLLGGLNNIIDSELIEVCREKGNYLESQIPLVTFREYLYAISGQDHILGEEEVIFFKYLFDETKTWKSKDCDLVFIFEIDENARSLILGT